MIELSTVLLVKLFLLGFYILSGVIIIPLMGNIHPMNLESPIVQILMIIYLPLTISGIILGFSYKSVESQLFRTEMKDYFVHMIKSMFRMNDKNMSLFEYFVMLPSLINMINNAENPIPLEPKVEETEDEEVTELD